MDEKAAKAVAEALGGSAWDSGGGIWLVRCERADGRVVLISDEAVCEYTDGETADQGEPATSITLH